MHSLLQRQIEKHFGAVEQVPQEWQAFIQDVDETYQRCDPDLAARVEAQGRKLLDVIQAMALGNFDVQVEIPEGVDVMSDLAIGLDMMVDDFRDMLAEQVQAREEVEQVRRELDAALQQVLAVQRRYIRERWESYVEEQVPVSGYELIEGQGLSATDVWLAAMKETVQSGQPVAQEEGNLSTLALPLEFFGEILGVLGFVREGEGGWGEGELETVRAVLEQVAQALENQRLLDEQQRVSALMAKRVRELDCLSDIGRRLDTSPSIPDLLAWVTTRIPAAMQYPDECRVAVEFEGRVYGDTQALVLPSQMVQGLRIGGELVGQLYVAYTQPHDFLNEESALLGDVARRIGGYIEVRQLLEQIQANAEQLGVLYELSQELTAQLDLDQVLEQVYRGVSRLIDTTNFYVGLYDRAHDQIVFPLNVTESVADRQISAISVNSGISGYIVRTGQVVFIPADVRQWMAEHEIKAVGEPAQSFLGVPLLLGDQVQGVIGVQDYRRPYVYTERDRDLLVAIAAQASIAIQNARLFEQSQKRIQQLAVLNEIGRAASGLLDYRELLKTIYEQLRWILDIDVFFVADYDQEQSKIHFPFLYDAGQMYEQAPLPLNPNSMVYQVLQSGEPLLVLRTAEELESGQFVPLGNSTRMSASLIYVPIMLGGRVNGVLSVQSYHLNAYTREDLDLLLSVVNQLAAALQSARLFEQVQQRARREQILRQIASRVRGATDPDVIVRSVVRELGMTLGRRTFVRLGNADALAQPSVAETPDS